MNLTVGLFYLKNSETVEGKVRGEVNLRVAVIARKPWNEQFCLNIETFLFVFGSWSFYT